MGLYRDESGMVIEISDAFAEARGYTPLDPVERAGINVERGEAARADERGIIADVNTTLTGIASGMTIGGTDALMAATFTPFELEQVNAEIEARPYLRTAGELGGALVTGLAAPGSALARTPTGYLSGVAGRAAAEGLAQGGVAGTAKALGAMGAEGAIQNAGQYFGHAALADKEATAEGLAGAIGTGFAFASVGGGAVLGVARGAMASRRLWSRVMDGPVAAKEAESAWSLASQEALDAHTATARTAETKLDEIRKAKMEAMRYRNETRSRMNEERIATQGMPEKGIEMPTSGIVDEAVGPEPLIDVRPQSGAGGQTSAFRRPAPADAAPAGEPPLDYGIAPAKGGQVTSAHRVEWSPDGTKKIARPEAPAANGLELGPEYQTRLPTRSADVVDDTITTVSARDIEAHGFDSLSIPGKDKVKTAKAQQAIKEGQRDPITIVVSPKGRYTIEDGTHRLAAAIEQGKPIKVKWARGSAGLDEAAPSGYIKAAKGNEGDTSINEWLDEKRVFDNTHADPNKTKPIPRPDLQANRQATLAEIRYKATEDLLGPAIAKEEQRLTDVMEEFTAAQKDVEYLIGLGDISDGVPLRRSVSESAPIRGFTDPNATGRASPGKRKAIEILDDAHEEALLRAKHAADPSEAGRAITEAEELERLLDEISDGVPQSIGGSKSDRLGEELLRDIKKLWRYEESSAKLADALGDQAHPGSTMHAKGVRDAEKDSMRKVMDRSARAVDDAETFGPTYASPKERVQYARRRHNDAQGQLDEIRVREKEAQDAFNKAGKQVRETEKAKKAALRMDAKTGAAAARFGAQDAGGIMELADIPGLPKPSDLPVVGPLIGAYLKFRTLKRALGRFGGKVPATADNRVAALASGLRDRVARAVDRSLGVLERGGKFASRAMPPTAGVLAQRIWDDGDEDPGKKASITKQAAARMREISAYVHTPGAIERDVRQQLRDVVDPDVIAAAEKHRRVMMEYLLKSMPKVPEQGLIKTLDYEPSPAVAMSFARRLEALNDPASVFEKLAQEQALLSLEAAEALREVYPQIFKQAQQRAIERAGQPGTKVPYRQRIQMSLFYRLPFDSALDPVNLQITQSVYDRKPTAPVGGMPGAMPQPSVAQPTNLAQSLTPVMDRR